MLLPHSDGVFYVYGRESEPAVSISFWHGNEVGFHAVERKGKDAYENEGIGSVGLRVGVGTEETR